MPMRDVGLIIDSLGHSMSFHTTTSNATLSASLAPAVSQSRVMLSNLPWSVKNMTAAAVTVTMSVRDSSIGGNVRASWDLVVGTNATLQDSWAINIKGLRGQSLNVDMGLLPSSVTGRVAAVGWEERSSN